MSNNAGGAPGGGKTETASLPSRHPAQAVGFSLISFLFLFNTCGHRPVANGFNCREAHFSSSLHFD